VIDSTNGQVAPVQTWSEGTISGNIYDFVTWSTDSQCSPGCPTTQNYKRLTVAVTVTTGLKPNPVYSSSSIADPAAAPVQGIQNGNAGNPLASPATQCLSGGQTVDCEAGIISGNPNTWFLHDCAATLSTCATPSSSHVTNPTSGPVASLLCTTSTATAQQGTNLGGCPTPDKMDTTPPSGPPTTPCYQYSTDVATTGYPCGTLIQPTCSSSTDGCGTGSAGDCSGGSWASNLVNVQTHFWVSSPLTATTTLTGDGALNMYSQAAGGVNAVVSFCIEIYRIPPEGTLGSVLTDILAWPPVALGGAAYVAPTDPSTGGNWPTSPTQTAFTFNFRGSQGAIALQAGDRIGVRIWAKVNLNTAIDLIYDNPGYPAQLQLNSQ
jgi:hypothetical protein